MTWPIFLYRWPTVDPFLKRMPPFKWFFLIPFWKNTERALISLLLGAMLGTCWDARGQKLRVKLPSKLAEKSVLNIFNLFYAILWGHYWMEFLVLYLHQKCWLRAELAVPGHQGGHRREQRGSAQGLGAQWPHAGPHLVQGGDFHSCPPNVEMRSCLNWQPSCFLPTSWLAKKKIIDWPVLL